MSSSFDDPTFFQNTSQAVAALHDLLCHVTDSERRLPILEAIERLKAGKSDRLFFLSTSPDGVIRTFIAGDAAMQQWERWTRVV